MIRHRNRPVLGYLGYALAATLALPLGGGIAQAASMAMSNRVETVIEHGNYGRAGGEAYWSTRQAQPVPAPVKKAYDRTTDWLSDRADDWRGQPAPQQPAERFGREG